MKLSREKLHNALETMPIESLMGKGVSGNLTPKEKRFAREIAINGATKVEAYRKAYNTKSKHTQRKEPYMVANRPSVAQEIEALKLAEAAQALQTPAQLRALVIQTLVQTAIDPETKPAVRVQAAKVLGTVAEVGAFVHRTEVKHIGSSEAAKAKVLAEIRQLMLGTDDATDIEATSLLAELDTPSQYDDTQVVDFIDSDTSDNPESAENPDKIPPKQGEIVGGVCGVLGGGEPDLGLVARDSHDILSHSNDSILPPNDSIPPSNPNKSSQQASE
jgi:hypothetical protein